MWSKWIERGKTVLIIILAVSAGFIVIRNAAKNSVFSSTPVSTAVSWLEKLFGGMESTSSETEIAAEHACHPSVAAVNTDAGRFGAMADFDALDSTYDRISGVFREALGTAAMQEETNSEAWEAALRENGVYLSFPAVFPAEVFAGWLGTEYSGTADADAYVLTEGYGEYALLFLSDGESYYVCETGVENAAVKSVTEEYSPNDAQFAFELSKMNDVFENIYPYTLIMQDGETDKTVLNAKNPLIDQKAVVSLIEALGLNPYTESYYTDAKGNVMYVYTEGVLRIYADGSVSFDSASPGSSALDLHESMAEGYDAVAAIEGARKIAQETVGAHCGESRVYMSGYEESGSGICTVEFSYYAGGMKIQSGENGYAAKITVSGGCITEVLLYYRHYTASDETSYLLRPVYAAALSVGGKPLKLEPGYRDQGLETVKADWIS